MCVMHCTPITHIKGVLHKFLPTPDRCFTPNRWGLRVVEIDGNWWPQDSGENWINSCRFSLILSNFHRKLGGAPVRQSSPIFPKKVPDTAHIQLFPHYWAPRRAQFPANSHRKLGGRPQDWQKLAEIGRILSNFHQNWRPPISTTRNPIEF